MATANILNESNNMKIKLQLNLHTVNGISLTSYVLDRRKPKRLIYYGII
jgi:hypothetical protein